VIYSSDIVVEEWIVETQQLTNSHHLSTAPLATVPVTEETRLVLDELMSLDNAPVHDVLARAVEAYWNQRLHDASNDAYAELRQDPEAWAAFQEERIAWETTLMDGLALNERFDSETR